MTHTLPPLPYSYKALEPYLDGQMLKIHHQQHHQAYVDKLNQTLADYEDLAAKPLAELLNSLELLPEAVQKAIVNFGGGHYNHSFFWTVLCAPNKGKPTGSLLAQLEEDFGSFEGFKAKFKEAALALFGSGWVWLISEPQLLTIYSTPNQESPIMEGKKPILGLDLWEHAYHIQYQSHRAEYLEAWWQIVNWEQVTSYYEKESK